MGIVICGREVGLILLVSRNPAKILPIRSRLIELISIGLFSLIRIRVGKRGWPSKTKKMMRVL